MKRLWLLLYDLTLALWVGGAALFTLLLTPAIFRAFDRDRAGEVVNALFPVYFPFLLWLSAAAVALLLLLGAGRSAAGRAALLLAVLAVGVNAWHLWKVYPDGLAARRQVGSFVRDPADSPARKEFRRLHGISSALNLLALVDGLVLLAFARRLRDG